MTQPIIKHSLNRDLFEQKFEKMDKTKTKTIPDKSLSIREIIARFTRGIPYEPNNVFFGEENPHETAAMDIIDKDNKVRQAKEFLNDVQERVKKEKFKKQVDKEVDKFRTQMEKDAAENQLLPPPNKIKSTENQ